jgi:hypothetical protein
MLETDTDYLGLILEVPFSERVHLLALDALTQCEDPDQIVNVMIFARGILLQELAEQLFSVTESPYHLINIMVLVPGLRDMAWQRFLALNPRIDVFFHVLSIPEMRSRAQAEIDRLKRLSPKTN